MKKKPTLSIALLVFSFAYGAPVSNAFPERIQSWCKLLSTDLQSVKYNFCIAQPWKLGGESTKKEIIPKLEIGKSGGKKILILGAIHGDEISSVSLVFKFLEMLDSVEPNAPLKQYSYLVAPLLNPDGYNIRPRTRTNANKVDLNRNFNTLKWNQEALSHWKTRTKSDPRRFPGNSPGSEVETQVMQSWIAEFNPDLIISVHAPYGLIDHDGPVVFPNLKHPLKVQALGAFPGSLGQYAGVEKKIPVITIELDAAKKLPEPKKIEELLLFVLSASAK